MKQVIAFFFWYSIIFNWHLISIGEMDDSKITELNVNSHLNHA